MTDYTVLRPKQQCHALGVVSVVLVHLLLFWGIQSTLSHEVKQKVEVPVTVLLLSPDKPKSPVIVHAPVRQPASLAPVLQPPEVPALPVLVAGVASEESGVLAPAPTASVSSPQTDVVSKESAVLAFAPTVSVPASQTDVVRTAAVVSAAQCEKPEYPRAARRLEETGTVHLRFLVGVDGKVLRSEVEKTSGFWRLDEAARAGLAKCQFQPATVNGEPEQAWANMRYTWRLE